MFVSRVQLQKNLQESASWFSDLSYSYLSEFFRLGNEVELSDCWEPASHIRAEILSEKLENQWENELRKKNPNLSKAILRANHKEILLSLLSGVPIEGME